MAHNGRNALVTGCSSGIGRLAAGGLKEKGWRVIAAARKEKDVARLRAEGFEAVALDLADPASIEKAASEVMEMTGGLLDALVNNAAFGVAGAVEDLSRGAMREQFEVNVFGTMELTNRLIPFMRRRGRGRIVMIGSILGIVALPFRGAYNASKFALEGFTDTLRMELKGSGIHVSIIEPGPITSRFRENSHAAFKRHIDPAASPHAETYVEIERRLLDKGYKAPFTLGPEAVLKKLVHALESPRPKVRYHVTTATHILALLRRALPARLLDMILIRSG